MPEGRVGTLAVARACCQFLLLLSWLTVALLEGRAWAEMSPLERPRLLSTPYFMSWPCCEVSQRPNSSACLGYLAVEGTASALPPTKLTVLWLRALAGRGGALPAGPGAG